MFNTTMPNLIPFLKQVRWRKLACKAATVVTVEVVMNAAGLDTIANYAGFIAENQNTIVELAANVINMM
jgi:hypothetical protein